MSVVSCPLCNHPSLECFRKLDDLIAIGLGNVQQNRITPKGIARARARQNREGRESRGGKVGRPTYDVYRQRIEAHAAVMRARQDTQLKGALKEAQHYYRTSLRPTI